MPALRQDRKVSQRNLQVEAIDTPAPWPFCRRRLAGDGGRQSTLVVGHLPWCLQPSAAARPAGRGEAVVWLPDVCLIMSATRDVHPKTSATTPLEPAAQSTPLLNTYTG